MDDFAVELLQHAATICPARYYRLGASGEPEECTLDENVQYILDHRDPLLEDRPEPHLRVVTHFAGVHRNGDANPRMYATLLYNEAFSPVLPVVALFAATKEEALDCQQKMLLRVSELVE